MVYASELLLLAAHLLRHRCPLLLFHNYKHLNGICTASNTSPMEIETEGETYWDGMEIGSGLFLVFCKCPEGILEVQYNDFSGWCFKQTVIYKPGGPALSSRVAPSPHILPPNKKTTSIFAYSSKVEPCGRVRMGYFHRFLWVSPGVMSRGRGVGGGWV